jgi:hypothetical protein
MPKTSKKGNQITWYIPKNLNLFVKNIQKAEGLSRNETISLLVEWGLKIYRFKDKIEKASIASHSSSDSVIEKKMSSLD